MTDTIPRYVDVAVPLPLRSVLTYAVPVTMKGCREPGARVVVPVGRRLMTGVIVGRSAASSLEPRRIRQVAELLDTDPAIPTDLMRLVTWAARYYVAPPGGLMAAALPPGSTRRSETLVARASRPPTGGDKLGPEEIRALSRIPDFGSIPSRRLGLPRAALQRLEAAGHVELVTSLKPPVVREKQARSVRLVVDDLDAALHSCRRAPRQQAVLRLLAAAPGRTLAADEVRDRLGPVAAALKALRVRGFVREIRREVRRSPLIPEPAPAPAAGEVTLDRRKLTSEQSSALEEVSRAMEERNARSFLLMGVTGSGKTEVYVRSIERCLAAGRSAIYLVPEIALTPLLARELRHRLGGQLAILHSSLGLGERFDEWRRARGGQARVVLGARSAVLAPLSALGLIIVDEEQDASYKQEEDPRYNARDLALVRARESGAITIMGSATPSVESYWAARAGRHRLLRLTSRIHERPMARVCVVDMRERLARTGREEVVSEVLRSAVEQRLARGEQAIILLNRRGYAPFALCRSCGAVDMCLRCSVGLTYHRTEDRMRCHYCGYRRGKPSTCGTCGSDRIALTGAGTEKLEEQMRSIFPQARLARLDRDTARGRRAPAEILSAFERGEFNLLVGTQMVAKGHDFPGVTVVGVVGADASLAMPDFRAAERTFQLLTQVAGRSGRGAEPGEVIVQAYHCEHYALQAAAQQDYASFFEKESRYRRIMKYPPFTVMANLIVQADRPDTGVTRVRLVSGILRAVAGDAMDVIGPAVAPLARLKGRYRYQILVKALSRRALSDALNEMADRLAAKGVSSSRDLTIDMDPVSFM